MRAIAVEEHWTTPGLTAALEALPEQYRDDSLALNTRDDNLARLCDLDELRIAMMDEQGIDLQILSAAPPGAGPLPSADAVALSRDLNDRSLDAVRRHPDRFRTMSTLPTSDPAAAAAELERAASLGAVGAMVYGPTRGVPLDDPRNDELFAAAAALGQPIFIHPQIPSRAIRDAAYGGFEPMTELALATFGWGWHIEAAVAALRLIARGTFDRHPDLQIVLGHWGELLLFWEDRIASIARIAGLQRPMSEYLRSNVFITCSGMLSVPLLRHVQTITATDRLMFSTDYPFQRPGRGEIEKFFSAFETDEDRGLFAHGNAQRLFGIDGMTAE